EALIGSRWVRGSFYRGRFFIGVLFVSLKTAHRSKVGNSVFREAGKLVDIASAAKGGVADVCNTISCVQIYKVPPFSVNCPSHPRQATAIFQVDLKRGMSPTSAFSLLRVADLDLQLFQQDWYPSVSMFV